MCMQVTVKNEYKNVPVTVWHLKYAKSYLIWNGFFIACVWCIDSPQVPVSNRLQRVKTLCVKHQQHPGYEEERVIQQADV